MIRIGICVDFDQVPEVTGVGFDYLDLPLSDIAALTESEYKDLLDYAEGTGIRIEACHSMLPDGLRITGPDTSARAQHEYLQNAFARARRLGAEVIAFDAPASRSVPPAFDFDMAWRQAGNFLRIVQGHASDFGLTVAVKGVNRTECNLLNHVSEATLMCSLLQLDRIGVLGDTVQMTLGSEPLDALSRAGNLLKHMHTGCATRRSLPREGDGENYERMFRLLRQCRYDGRISCAGQAAADGKSFSETAAGALQRLKAARASVFGA